MLRYAVGAAATGRRHPRYRPVRLNPGEPDRMSTAIAKKLMAEMKLLGIFGAFDDIIASATRDQISYTEFSTRCCKQKPTIDKSVV